MTPEKPPAVVEGEVVDLDALLDPTPPQRLPAVRTVCACGKDGTPFSHGEWGTPGEPGYRRPFTCAEVLEIAATVEAAQQRGRRLFRLFGGA